MRNDIFLAVTKYNLLNCGLPFATCCQTAGVMAFAHDLRATRDLIRDMSDAEIVEYAQLVCKLCPTTTTGGGGSQGVGQLQQCVNSITERACKEPYKTALKVAAANGAMLAATLPEPVLKAAVLSLVAICVALVDFCDNPAGVTVSAVSKACKTYLSIKSTLKAGVSMLPAPFQTIMSGDLLDQLEACCKAIPDIGGPPPGGGGKNPFADSGLGGGGSSNGTGLTGGSPGWDGNGGSYPGGFSDGLDMSPQPDVPMEDNPLNFGHGGDGMYTAGAGGVTGTSDPTGEGDMWNTGGTIAGGAAGAVIGGTFGPIGALVGGSIGSSIGGAVGGVAGDLADDVGDFLGF